MRTKTVILAGLVILFIFVFSELINYLSTPTSPSSIIINKFFINKAVSAAKMNHFDNAVTNLNKASTINIIGEYGLSRRPPANFAKPIDFSVRPELKDKLLNFIASLTPNDIKNDEDQGLSWIYYNLGLIAYENNSDVAEKLFNKAMYNYPEFPPFHTELINYYYVQNKVDDANQAMEYCHKFKDPAILCNKYKDDMNRYSTPQIVGYMKAPIKSHYISK